MCYVQTYLRIQVDITGLIKSERYQHLPCKLSQFCFVESNQVDIGQRSAPQMTLYHADQSSHTTSLRTSRNILTPQEAVSCDGTKYVLSIPEVGRVAVPGSSKSLSSTAQSSSSLFSSPGVYNLIMFQPNVMSHWRAPEHTLCLFCNSLHH